jgi:hypothetical protein
MFSELEKKQIADKGIPQAKIEAQIERYRKGFAPANITAHASVGDGILRLSSEETSFYEDLYNSTDSDVMKFVPASGAATRMFKLLYNFIEEFDGTEGSIARIRREEKKIGKFFSDIDEFAFYEELNQVVKNSLGVSIEDAKKELRHAEIVKLLLDEPGLGYGARPKGLLKFHKYENHVRTAAEEHLHEGLAYAEKANKVELHFTVSPEHMNDFQNHVSGAISQLSTDVNINVEYSTQKSETDTIASTPEFEPFRDLNNILLFRPAGHGALLRNLNDLFADLIFIKNIDNVVPDSLKSETIKFKKVLAGVLLSYQRSSFELLKKLDEGESILDEGRKLLLEMGIKGFTESDIPSLLNRPIRVCGMVKNEGEPGGGPFWVKNGEIESLQIVESAQINKLDSEQHRIFKKGTHFNPVDLVCGVKNYKGEKFDLINYRDEEAGFISEKSYNGKKLLAMELPGLWNGGMAHWNTIFVEVPLVTFNPVKTITDLLKAEHR